MHGLVPELLQRFRFEGAALLRQSETPRAPESGEVIVAVAGIALGNEPNAEIAGTVVAAGDAAAEWLGRRVVVPRILSCGDCDRCRRGQLASCAQRRQRSGLATHETVAARWLCSVEPPLWPSGEDGEELWRFAALADCAAGPWAALARAGVGPGDTVVVIGARARAAFTASIAIAKGARVVVDDGECEPIDRALVVAAHGSSEERRRALELAGIGARLAFVDGAEDSPAPIATDWARLVAREIQLTAVTGAHPDLLPELCALVVRRQLTLPSHVDRVDAAEAPAARAAFLAGKRDKLPIFVPA